ncbi:MAG: DUF4145 domain-containing protein [Pseudomonadota bacterium]
MPAVHELDQDGLALVNALLAESSESDVGVDSLSFRAAHFEKITVIDWMESAGYLRKDQERYHVSLTALVQLKDAFADQIVRDSETLFAALKQHYKRVQRLSLKVEELAAAVGLDLLAVKVALSYMVEAPWWSGRSSSFFTDPTPSICPSEAVLGYASFSDVIAQLRSWQATRIRDRQLALAGALRQMSTDVGGLARAQATQLRQRPDWIGKLPPTIKDLLSEIYSALTLDLRALPSMGVRAAIDSVCVEFVGDVGSFDQKLCRLVEEGYLLERERPILAAAIDAGSASAHRGHVPSVDDLGVLLDILERLLYGQYILPTAARQIQANTPLRPPRSSKGTK